ncbi:MAG: GTPase HflX [Candidatus Eremiobacteraeota bacterium]|nr:GTPase HflX [Candidatus Eremiobacteraeota bacterium]
MDRRGHVYDVFVGDAKGIEISGLGRYRAGRSRFRGLRFLHTHLRGEELSTDDLMDLALLRFDLVVALEVLPSGLPGLVRMAHLLPRDSREKLYEVLEPLSVHELDLDFHQFIESLEEEFALSAKSSDILDGRKRALLIGVTTRSTEKARESMEELSALAESAGIEVLETIIQRRQTIDNRYVMGKGKIKEIFITSLQLGATLIVFDRELTGSQMKSISEATDLEVIDRTQLILDIFAQRARSREGKIQVELAQLKYSLPRLVLKDDFLSRITGGIRARGPGETKLEIYRRRIKERIDRLNSDIDEIVKGRDERRKAREKTGIPVLSLIGYTNAGKSTLLNSLTESSVFVENRLFATLDPTTRRLRFPREREVIITDTVGFIREIPRDLLSAFRSTLEELREAHLLIHLFDASGPTFREHISAVNDILQELALDNIPHLLVGNKADKLTDEEKQRIEEELGCITISAIKKESLGVLTSLMEKEIWKDA